MIKKAISFVCNGLLVLLFIGFSSIPVSATPGDTLSSGETLTSNQSITSANGQHRLLMQPDGNLVEYFDNRPLWQSQTSGSGNWAVMQSDGNFVVYNSSNVALWHTNTGGQTGARLVMQSDGNLVLYSSGNAALWANYAQTETLESGQTLNADQFVLSANGQFRLLMQSDGNLVEYFGNRPLWSSGTQGAGNRAVMQTDGNLVIYNANNVALWNSGTSGSAGARLVMQSDGNLVIYPQSGAYLWASHTVNDTLVDGMTLTANQTIYSANGAYRVIMQPDGNLVQYDSQNRPVWFSGTGGAGNRAIMQPDGNLVIYNPSNFPLWSSGTGGNQGARIVVQNDGNLVIYSTSNWPVWVHNPSTPGAPASSYPDDDAKDCSGLFGQYSWCKDENGNGSYNAGEQTSARGYDYKNCTDYVAWKVPAVPSGLGDARNWDDNTTATVNKTPTVGSVGVRNSGGGGFGHVAYVESVSTDGKTVTVSQYNRAGNGEYGTESLSATSFDNYIHF